MKTRNEADVLQEKINERRDFLNKTFKFAEELLEKGGDRTHHVVHDFYTSSRYELNDFKKFSLTGSYGHSQFGGNDIKINYEGKPVLDLFFQSYPFKVEECDIKLFDENVQWQHDLSTLEQEKERHITSLVNKKNKTITNEQNKKKETVTVNTLKKEAQRLGIKID